MRVDEFKRFLLRGNVIQLAVGVIIGVAFTAVVDSLVADLITPLIAAVFGQPDFSALSVTINNSVLTYGSFLNALFGFLLTALVVFYFIVLPANRLQSQYMREETPEPNARKCPYCISEVSIDARRCAYCTSDLEPTEV